MRPDNRANDAHRIIKIIPNFMVYPEGSALIEYGQTKVICTATVLEEVPPFLKNSGAGWITAEYAMLPRSTLTRTKRERQKVNGRTYEIQRLIGRSLRCVVDTHVLGERTIYIDCDVVCADGGTRTASITGGFVAMALACQKMVQEGEFSKNPVFDYVAAMSLGRVNNQLLLDLEYSEDVEAQVDMNVVMTASQKIIEIQATAEKKAFTQAEMNEMLELGWKGVQSAIAMQREVVTL
ncbi:MAG: ribonuclease PH [Deltaproteobacteria bacterium]|nr:ribonuclease PH [Deltaproteobacteria bacterium]